MTTIPPSDDDELTDDTTSSEARAALHTDEEYHALIDADFEADGRRLKRKKLYRFLIAILFIGGAYAWYNHDPANKEKVQGVFKEAVAVKDAIQDTTSDMLETSEEIEKRSDAIESAAENIGAGNKANERPESEQTSEEDSLIGF